MSISADNGGGGGWGGKKVFYNRLLQSTVAPRTIFAVINFFPKM